MTENIRIGVLDQNDNLLCFMDNSLPNALIYWDEELHEYIKGNASTFTFKTEARHEDSLNIKEGHKVAFRYRKKDYYFNITSVTRDEEVVEAECWALNFELLNEHKGSYKAEKAMSFQQYFDVFNAEKTVKIGINEVKDKSISNEWTGDDTLLSRLFSLANVFDAELEFVSHLNDDYSLKEIVMNVYRAHDDTHQGMGEPNKMIIRYGYEITGIKKTSDISELYTCIFPEGRDGLRITDFAKEEKDGAGNVLYYTRKGEDAIYAPQARNLFPSNLMDSDRYISIHYDYDTDNVNTLYGNALSELKRNSVPQVTYEINGYADTGMGDTVIVVDRDYNPPLFLEARVTEQVRSFTDESKCKTTYSNIVELQSQIDESLLSKVQAMIEANKQYKMSVTSSAGTVFRNGTGQTTLKAYVYDKDLDITDSCNIKWYSGLADEVGTGRSIDVKATDIGNRLSYRFEAFLGEKYAGMYEVTLVNLNDGTDGTKLVARTAYYAISNSFVIPASGWSTNVLKATSANKYLWNYCKLEYSDGTTEETDKVIIGTYGEKGDTGTGIESITTEYYLSSSKTDQSDGSWVTTIPEFIAGKYLWSRTKTVYENPTSTEYSEPVYDSRWDAMDEAIAKAEDNATEQAIEVEQRLSSQINKTDSEIRMSVSEQYVNKNDFSDLRSQVDTQFIQTSDSFEMQFNEMMKSLSASDQSTADKFTEITKYIRFENGTIILGQKGNQLECKITNDRLSFYQSGHEVAYVSNNKLYVTDAEFLTSLRIGKFAFVPRANGSLDFKEVG